MELVKRNTRLLVSIAMVVALVAVAHPSELWDFLAGDADRTMIIATWSLALFALLQLAVSRDAAHRELRAYLFVRQAEERPLVWATTEFRFSSGLVLQNHGQTPAHDVRHWTAFGVRDHPHIDKPFTRSTSPTRATMPPGGSLEIPIDLMVTADEWQEIFDGRKRLYTWGEVIYRDAFGYEQTTRYRMVFAGADGRKHRALEICEEGNEAT